MSKGCPKVYVSCQAYVGTGWKLYALHIERPQWIESVQHNGGGWWVSADSILLCERHVRPILGDRTPEPGRLLDIELKMKREEEP